MGSKTVERFEIETPAGQGGMGVVYRARDRHTGEPVAIKFLARGGDEVIERFRREAREPPCGCTSQMV